MDFQQFEARKRDHLRQALDPAHQARGRNGLEQVHLRHEALPEFDFADLDLAEGFSRTPYFVAGMTAGHPDAIAINLQIANACETRGWVMGVGSQRRQLTDPGPTEWSELRKTAPRAFLVANLGVSQLMEASIDDLVRLVGTIQADALAIHLNPLQEALQPEGTPTFRGAFSALGRVVHEFEKRKMKVIVKETGCGMSRATLGRLAELPLFAVDVSGLGGTHWGRIEGARAKPTSRAAKAAMTFAAWGESTVSSVENAREILPLGTEVWASGGVRNGLEAAKLIALGAKRVGFAQPVLEAALRGGSALVEWMDLLEFELKVALFCTGSLTPAMLRDRKDAVWKS